LYRMTSGLLEILLVHPSGNYNKKAKWGIPKGLPDDGESLEASPRCASWEIDAAEFVAVEKALAIIHADQAELIARLLSALSEV